MFCLRNIYVYKGLLSEFYIPHTKRAKKGERLPSHTRAILHITRAFIDIFYTIIYVSIIYYRNIPQFIGNRVEILPYMHNRFVIKSIPYAINTWCLNPIDSFDA